MHEEINRIRTKIATNPWPKYLSSITISGLRGWTGQEVRFPFPITVISGENGSGKSTVLKAAACAYQSPLGKSHNYYPGVFFPDTPWERITGANINYIIREGNREHPMIYRKTSERWRNSGRKTERRVIFQDISRTLPIEATVGYAYIANRNAHETSMTQLSEDFMQYYRDIMGRNYSSARLAAADVNVNRMVGVVQMGALQFSQFHQGAGEDTVFDLLSLLQNIPDTSLILIDEIEASLHPRSQRRFVHFLLWLVRTKQIQVIITTHSPYIIEELPAEARVFVERLIEGRGLLYGITSAYAVTKMDDIINPDLYLFTEDMQASTLTSVLLRQAGIDVSRIDFVEVGAANVVRTLGIALNRESFPLHGLGIIDPDQEDSSHCIKLPGSMAPEKQIFLDISSTALSFLSDRLGLHIDSLRTAFENTTSLIDHHAWITQCAMRTGQTSDYLWQTMCEVWVKHCLDPGKLRDFKTSIESAMNIEA